MSSECIFDFEPEGESFGPCSSCGSSEPHVRVTLPSTPTDQRLADCEDALATVEAAYDRALPSTPTDREAALDAPRRMLRWVASQPVGFGDWACVDCRPDSDVLVAGFRCMVHEARAALATLATQVQHPLEPEPEGATLAESADGLDALVTRWLSLHDEDDGAGWPCDGKCASVRALRVRLGEPR